MLPTRYVRHRQYVAAAAGSRRSQPPSPARQRVPEDCSAARSMARQLSLKGEWAPGCAGGCPKNETYGLNPQFHLSPSQPASFTITVSQPADASPLLPIGVVLLNREPNAPFKPKLSSKRLVGKTNYKATASQSLTIQLEPPAAGKCYAILPSTFEPEQYRSIYADGEQRRRCRVHAECCHRAWPHPELQAGRRRLDLRGRGSEQQLGQPRRSRQCRPQLGDARASRAAVGSDPPSGRPDALGGAAAPARRPQPRWPI